jgi:hypothetical protein
MRTPTLSCQTPRSGSLPLSILGPPRAPLPVGRRQDGHDDGCPGRPPGVCGGAPPTCPLPLPVTPPSRCPPYRGGAPCCWGEARGGGRGGHDCRPLGALYGARGRGAGPPPRWGGGPGSPTRWPGVHTPGATCLPRACHVPATCLPRACHVPATCLPRACHVAPTPLTVRFPGTVQELLDGIVALNAMLATEEVPPPPPQVAPRLGASPGASIGVRLRVTDDDLGMGPGGGGGRARRTGRGATGGRALQLPWLPRCEGQ